ncbi:pilin [Patescibacteria group bacterium]
MWLVKKIYIVSSSILVILFVSLGLFQPWLVQADYPTNFGTESECTDLELAKCASTGICCWDTGAPLGEERDCNRDCSGQDPNQECIAYCSNLDCDDPDYNQANGDCSCLMCGEPQCEDPSFPSDSATECTQLCQDQDLLFGGYAAPCCTCKDETCAHGAIKIPSSEACQDHCKGEFAYDADTTCCTCTGTSFTDENTCRIYCNEQGDWYSYDPDTPPYCTCEGNNVTTEDQCRWACYRSNYEDYQWDASAPDGERCTCLDGQGNHYDPDSRYTSPGTTGLEAPIGSYTSTDSITGYIKQIYLFASGIVGGLAAIMIVIGGIQYVTAAGNQKGVSSAKETITSAIIGLVVVGTAYLILGTFGTQFTNLEEPDLPTISAFGYGAEDTIPRSIGCGTSGTCQLIPGGSGMGACAGKDLGDPCTADSEQCAQYSTNPAECDVQQGCQSCYIPSIGHSCTDTGADCSHDQEQACKSKSQGCFTSQHCRTVNDNSNACRAELQQRRDADNGCRGCFGAELREVSGSISICCTWRVY